MDNQNNEGGAAEDKNDETEEKEDNSTRNKGCPGLPGFLFDQPKQRKKEYWQCIKLVAPTLEAKTWKASKCKL